MKKYLYAIIGIFALALTAGFFVVQNSNPANPHTFSLQAADESLLPFNDIYKAEILEVKNEEQIKTEHFSSITATLHVRLLDGNDKGAEVEAEYQDQLTNSDLQKMRPGDRIVVGKISTPDETAYSVVDRYRLPALWWLVGLFVLCALVFGRVRGLMSLAGLLFSIAVLIYFIAPNLLAGKNPLLVTLVGAGGIIYVSIFLSHGFKQRTVIAVIGTVVTLLIAEVVSYFFVVSAQMLGKGTGDAFYLQQGFLGALDMRGLLLSGVIIGTLGVLDDITTAQAAAVEEIHAADRKLGFGELFRRGTSVGKEHIASLVNTLVLAYAGASLPLFLLLTLNSRQPLWVILNSEFMAEEILRGLVGSIALIIAVPITTSLAAWYFS